MGVWCYSALWWSAAPVYFTMSIKAASKDIPALPLVHRDSLGVAHHVLHSYLAAISWSDIVRRVSPR